MLNRNKTTRTLFYGVCVITVAMAITSCRSAYSGLSGENDDDPFAANQEDADQSKEDLKPEYRADWNIEFVSRKVTRFPFNPQVEPKVEIESILVTKDDKVAQQQLVAFRTPGPNATPFDKTIAECRGKLLDNFEKSLLPSAGVGDVAVPADPEEGTEIQIDGQDAAAADVQQPDPKIVAMARDMLKELEAESLHYRLVIMTSDLEIAQDNVGNTKILKMLPNDQTRVRTCNMADIQLQWVFLKKDQDLPKNEDGSIHWHGLLNFDGISTRNPQINVRALQTAFQSSKKYAARRFQVELDAQNPTGIDNLR